MSTVVSRAYNHFTVDWDNGIIHKRSSNARLGGEIEYLLSTPRSVAQFFPRILAHTVPTHEDPDEYSVSMEMYDYYDLGHTMINEAPVNWFTIMQKLHMVLNRFSRIHPPTEGFPTRAAAEDMYRVKTKREYLALRDMHGGIWPKLFTAPRLCIDGVEYRNFSEIWSDVETYIEHNMCNYTPTMIHGDFCLSNILYSKRGIVKLIDPRGEFGIRGIYGDPLYDVAKLMHSVDGGYELLIHDRFYVTGNPEGIDFEIVYENGGCHMAKTAFDETFADVDIRKLTILQGLIFVGMAARHYDSPKRQMAMYLIGIRLLNKGMVL